LTCFRWIADKNVAIRDKIWFVPNSKGVLVCYLCSKTPLYDREGRVIGPYEDLKPAVDYLNSHFTESITIEGQRAVKMGFMGLISYRSVWGGWAHLGPGQ
jgi:hypothetical protein